MSESFARITEDEILESEIRAAVDSASSGAVVVFHGIVRNHDGGRDVLSLDYKAHPEAERFIQDCVEQEQQRTGLKLAASHRIGTLLVGDTALVAAAAAAHRGEAFAAIESLVERIKREVPIWKRQHFADGQSEWVGL